MAREHNERERERATDPGRGPEPPENPVHRLIRIAREHGVDIEHINVEEMVRERGDFYRGVLEEARREDLERLFGHHLRYESHGGYGE